MQMPGKPRAVRYPPGGTRGQACGSGCGTAIPDKLGTHFGHKVWAQSNPRIARSFSTAHSRETLRMSGHSSRLKRSLFAVACVIAASAVFTRGALGQASNPVTSRTHAAHGRLVAFQSDEA